MSLRKLGWDQFYIGNFEALNKPGCFAGRVTMEHMHLYQIQSEMGEYVAVISGKMRHEAYRREDYPAVGDWVAWSPMDGEKRGVIHAVLPRKSKFSRKVAGNTVEEQIVATNVDTLFLLNSLNHDFNPRRMERYLILAWESGANPVIVLTKSDLCTDIEDKINQMAAVAPGVPILTISSLLNEGMEALDSYLIAGQTIALLGSSGVGKSTLINFLLGEELQEVKEVRGGDDRGKHTTTFRQLFLLPNGAMMIDTPGMRELQLWQGSEGIKDQFNEIEELAAQCYFNDCSHGREPECAVQLAIHQGTLEIERYESYLKLQRELRYMATKENDKLRFQEKERVKRLHTQQKNHKSMR
ncbi:ribosome small subunit-dependent GTPase A [Paenibacillus psychroresistens]|uniref:Small ribosomal subunit biogenesis GTPase RsgA n=1 Tax=Paenibacillus psychroresistens TaxID=1778678 RepID=A0A6B8RPU1_9BACL|nr:ribosome small subunit-dependent GTPase A [Paenibacillus psychroresistens]QGQ98029.1 ribosome small subunit-dependent GTPase A [Paenibacillus psychroresistens]